MFGLFLAALFIAQNGFFVAAEFALVKVRATQLQPRVRKGERSAVIASQIVKRLDRYLSATQLGITLASLGLGWVGEPALSALLHGPIVRYVPESAHRAAEIATVALAFGLLTFFHILVGELVPKLIAIQRTEQTALITAIPLRITFLVFRPALWILERGSGLILRMMGLKPGMTSEGTLSEEEIIGILARNTERSPQGKQKSELVERVLRFAERTARHAMVPRVDVAFVPLHATGAAAMDQIRGHGYSRVLVTKERSLDEVAGYLYVKDLLDRSAAEAPDLARYVRDVLFVPEGRSLMDVLRDMQRTHTHIAVVVDEYGGTSGIVTMEDLLEEIVGEIRDELDVEPPRVQKVDGEGWDVDGRASMEELGDALGVELEDQPEQVGAVVLQRLARLPRAGDKVELGPGVTAEVTSISRRRITKVRVRLNPAVSQASP